MPREIPGSEAEKAEADSKDWKKNDYIPEAANRINFRAVVTTSASYAKLTAVHGRAALLRPAYYRVHYGLL